MKTTKLDLASALMSLGANLEEVNRDDPKQMEFVLSFSGPFSAEKDWFDSRTIMWDRRELVVNVRDYVDAQQKLKSEVHR